MLCNVDRRFVFYIRKVKRHLSISFDTHKANTVYQFHGCHWRGHTCTRICAKRQKMGHKDTCQIDRLVVNNGCDIKYHLVSKKEYKKAILGKMWFEKKFKPHPLFIVYDFKAVLKPFNKHLKYELTYLSRNTPASAVNYDILHCGNSVQIPSFFWSVFSCIRTEYWDLLRKSPY